MAFETIIYDAFELFGNPFPYAHYTIGPTSERYPANFGEVIEPITVKSSYFGAAHTNDTMILDGEEWKITTFWEATMGVTHGDYYASPNVPYQQNYMYIVGLSDGTTQRYLAIVGDGNWGYLKDQNGKPLPGTHLWLDRLDRYHYLNLTDLKQNDNFLLGAVCFASGSMIETATGPRPVQSLRVGDLVLTRDSGLQPLRWIGGRLLSTAELEAAPNLLPVRIAADALGPGLPAQDLTVSPQHRVLLRTPIAARMAGNSEVLVAAVHLVGMPGITRCGAKGGVGYWHLMFDRHEIVFANGAESESLYLGPMALQSLSPSARAELRALFPDLMRGPNGDTRPLARPVMRGSLVRKLLERQIRHGKPLVSAGA